eukprot:801170_1
MNRRNQIRAAALIEAQHVRELGNLLYIQFLAGSNPGAGLILVGGIKELAKAYASWCSSDNCVGSNRLFVCSMQSTKHYWGDKHRFRRIDSTTHAILKAAGLSKFKHCVTMECQID